MDKMGKYTGRGEFQEFLLGDQEGIVFGVDLYNYNKDVCLLFGKIGKIVLCLICQKGGRRHFHGRGL